MYSHSNRTFAKKSLSIGAAEDINYYIRYIPAIELREGNLLVRRPQDVARWICFMDATALVPSKQLPCRHFGPWKLEYPVRNFAVKWQVPGSRKHLLTVEGPLDEIRKIWAWCETSGWSRGYVGTDRALNILQHPHSKKWHMMLCAPPSGLDALEMAKALGFAQKISQLATIHDGSLSDESSADR